MSRVLLQKLVESIVIAEGIADDLKQKHPNLSNEIDALVETDPSKKNKYLRWSVRQLDKGASMNDLVPTLDYFHKQQIKFPQKDINNYKSLKDLEDKVKEISSAVSKTQEKKDIKLKGADKVYEDDRFVLLFIKDKNAAMCYGTGTKWCITMANTNYYDDYTSQGVIFYFIIDKSLSPEDPLHKVAYAIYRDGNKDFEDVEVYDAKDDQIDIDEIPEEHDALFDIIKNDTPSRPESFMRRLKNRRVSAEEALGAVDGIDWTTESYKTAYMLMDALDDDEQISQFLSSEHATLKSAAAIKIGSEDYLVPFINSNSDVDDDEEFQDALAVRFKNSPEHFPKFLESEYYEIRAAVVKKIAVEYLPKLINDESPMVRREVAQRIDMKHLLKMFKDDSDGVRLEIVKRIPEEFLERFINDKSSRVRAAVASRIDPQHLSNFVLDAEPKVKLEVIKRLPVENLYLMIPKISERGDDILKLELLKRIPAEHMPKLLELWSQGNFDLTSGYRGQTLEFAKRIDVEYLPRFINNRFAEVQEVISQRISPQDLPKLMNSAFPSVRETVARRAIAKDLVEMVNDTHFDVRNTLAQRLNPEDLPQMLNQNNHEYTRAYIARRIPTEYLPQMLNDKSAGVRMIVNKRLGEE